MFEYSTRVYYEDTDAGGVVYYANYLKFIERARTNLIQELGFSLQLLSEKHDCHFVVKNIHCHYIQSAKLEDELIIRTQFLHIKKASFELEQNIYRDGRVIFESRVLMVNINSKGNPNKIPEALTASIND